MTAAYSRCRATLATKPRREDRVGAPSRVSPNICASALRVCALGARASCPPRPEARNGRPAEGPRLFKRAGCPRSQENRLRDIDPFMPRGGQPDHMRFDTESAGSLPSAAQVMPSGSSPLSGPGEKCAIQRAFVGYWTWKSLLPDGRFSPESSTRHRCRASSKSSRPGPARLRTVSSSHGMSRDGRRCSDTWRECCRSSVSGVSNVSNGPSTRRSSPWWSTASRCKRGDWMQ